MKRKNTKFKKGMIVSYKTRLKISKANIKNAKVNPNYGMKGKNHTLETKLKISLYRKGKHLSKESKLKLSLMRMGKNNPAYGKPISEEHRRKIKEQAKNNPNFGMKGKTTSKEARIKQSLAHIGKCPWNKGKIGKESHSWLGGKSFEPYSPEFNKKFKHSIRLRDNYCCMICNLPNNILSVHHIDYNKLNSINENCLALCKSCHMKTNWNRNHWTKFFQSLLTERYGYKYTDNQEIVININ